eukprot:TRINITY_DN7863_c0_g1_i2.p1 TRINITY_DN7863_c0_g1~~TRINITY_DN7863_c0_g1_i2.p1  ORF type:complete len:453 (+),score=89.97 TRINITY_DN7863_c0_g1_i2:292-1650(+)
MQQLVRVDELVIRICTWNVAETPPDEAPVDELRKWVFQKDHEAEDASVTRCPIPDVIAIGLQEVDMSALAMIREKTKKGKEWAAYLRDIICGSTGTPTRYREVSSKQLMGLGLFVYAKHDIELHMTNVETRGARTGFFNSFGNKGAVCARFSLEGKSFCFINCHLAAHQEKVDKRNQDHRRIRNITAFTRVPQRLLEHDSVFWFGDLNYRLDLSREEVVGTLALDCKRSLMAQHDQLTAEMRHGRAFQGFTEPIVTWAPTYKLKRGEAGAYSKKRSPAYCDRILYATSAADGDEDAGDPTEPSEGALSPADLGDLSEPRLPSVGSMGSLDLFECVVCDRRDPGGQLRRSGWKCQPCVGKKSQKARRGGGSGVVSSGGSGVTAVMPCDAFAFNGSDHEFRAPRTPPCMSSEHVLFGRPSRPPIRCLAYIDDPELTSSDHRPVHGVFAVSSVFR